MTIEERVECALLDFECALRDGDTVDKAALSAASTYDLKIDVLRHRAEKAFGNLEEAASRFRAAAAGDMADSEFKKIAYDFADRHFEWRVNNPQKVLDDFLKEIGEQPGISLRDIILTQKWENATFATTDDRKRARSLVMDRLKSRIRDYRRAPNQ